MLFKECDFHQLLFTATCLVLILTDNVVSFLPQDHHLSIHNIEISDVSILFTKLEIEIGVFKSQLRAYMQTLIKPVIQSQ